MANDDYRLRVSLCNLAINHAMYCRGCTVVRTGAQSWLARITGKRVHGGLTLIMAFLKKYGR